MKLTPKMQQVLANLQESVESERGEGWGSVYLDNAKPKDMSSRAYAGVLSALEKAGLYKPESDAHHKGYFGSVRIVEEGYEETQEYRDECQRRNA